MLKFLDSLFWGDTFNTRIKIKFLDYANDSLIEEVELPQEYLPESFEQQTSIFIENKEWLIVKAFPVHANQYSLDKKLTLWIKDPIESMLRKVIDHPAETKIHFGVSSPRNNL